MSRSKVLLQSLHILEVGVQGFGIATDDGVPGKHEYVAQVDKPVDDVRGPKENWPFRLKGSGFLPKAHYHLCPQDWEVACANR